MEIKTEFENVLDKARELTDFGIKKADSVIRLSKLKLECVRLDSEIKAKYTELGKMVYSMVKNDNADAEKIAQKVNKIEYMYKKLKKYRNTIEQEQRIITCPTCGTKNKYSDIYCSNCATRLIVTDEEPEDIN